jgi:hypothetical protein
MGKPNAIVNGWLQLRFSVQQSAETTPGAGGPGPAKFSNFAGSFVPWLDLFQACAGRVAEWFKAPVLKTGRRETVS